jgi:signal transduction histidine kinase
MNHERLKASQDVAVAIAHELRNPVMGIVSAAQLLRYKIADDPFVERNLGRILREAQRLDALVSALTEYGRPEPLRLAQADPDRVWADVLATNRGVLESKALLVTHTPASARNTRLVDEAQLAEACINVLANAIDASAEGGDIAITSSLTSDGAWTSRVHNGGAAIPADILPRAFDPLVTTKPGHAGIGLAVARRIIGDHGGSIALQSSESEGTTVILTLPARP